MKTFQQFVVEGRFEDRDRQIKDSREGAFGTSTEPSMDDVASTALSNEHDALLRQYPNDEERAKHAHWRVHGTSWYYADQYGIDPAKFHEYLTRKGFAPEVVKPFKAKKRRP